jgi:hypothetical protein
VLLRAATRQTGREDQGDHEAHGTSCNEFVSVSYLLSVVMLCPNLVGMESPMSATSMGPPNLAMVTTFAPDAPRHISFENAGFTDVGVLEAAC